MNARNERPISITRKSGGFSAWIHNQHADLEVLTQQSELVAAPDELADFEARTFKQSDRASLVAVRRALLQSQTIERVRSANRSRWSPVCTNDPDEPAELDLSSLLGARGAPGYRVPLPNVSLEGSSTAGARSPNRRDARSRGTGRFLGVGRISGR